MTTQDTRERISLERTYAAATPEEVWAFWTTREGIESAWAPDGFSATVSELDLRRPR